MKRKSKEVLAILLYVLIGVITSLAVINMEGLPKILIFLLLVVPFSLVAWYLVFRVKWRGIMKNTRIVTFMWISVIWLLVVLILTDHYVTVKGCWVMPYLLGLVGFFLGESLIYDFLFTWSKEMLIKNRSRFNDLKDGYEKHPLSSKNTIEKHAFMFKNTIEDVINILQANRDFVQWRIEILLKLVYSNLSTFLVSKAYSEYLKLSYRLTTIDSQIRDLEDESDSVSTYIQSKDNPY